MTDSANNPHCLKYNKVNKKYEIANPFLNANIFCIMLGEQNIWTQFT